MYYITVPKFEEQTDATGYLVTYYVVLIEYAPQNLRYSLYKRYSSFGILYDVLKTQYKTIEEFRFPNKSMFNTHANFTKERRRQGFDDFLKIVAQLHPMPHEVEEFLEIQDHVSKLKRKGNPANSAAVVEHQSERSAPISQQQSLAQQTTEDMKPNKDTKEKSSLQQINRTEVSSAPTAVSLPTSTQDSADLSKQKKLEPQFIKSLHKLSTPSAITGDVTSSKSNYEVIVNKRVQEVMPKVLRTTFAATLLVYFACIYSSIIDTSNTSVGKQTLHHISTSPSS